MEMNKRATPEAAEVPDSQIIPEVQRSSTEPVPEGRAPSEEVRPEPTDTAGDVTPMDVQESNPEADLKPEPTPEGQSVAREKITPALEDGAGGAVNPTEAQYKAARLKQALDHVLEGETPCEHQRPCGGDVAGDLGPGQSGRHQDRQKSTVLKGPKSRPPASAAEAPDSAKVQPRKATGPRNTGKRLTTAGEFLPDGSIIELIRDAESGELRFLVCAGEDRRVVYEVEFGSRSYGVPELGSSLARAVPLPALSLAYGSTQDLFAATLNSFSLYGMPFEAARACTYFSFATWCRSSIEPPPVLTISGPPAEAMSLQQLLACVVRRGLSVVELTSASFATVVEQLQPTLFIDARHFGGHGRTLLCASGRPAAYVLRGKDAVDLAVPKVIYVGAAPDPKLSLDFALHIHLPPSTDGNRPLTSRELRQLRSEFQPRFLEYRLRSLARVPDCDFDVPELPGESRVIARVLGACIVDDSTLRAGVRALLEDHETELRERRFTDRDLVVIEVLLARCHDPKLDAIRVKELAEDTSAVLKARGETAKLEPRAVGAILENLRVPREPRNSLGRRILLNASTKRWIHTLARDYRVESIEQQVPICPVCKEILGSDWGPKLKIVAEAQ